MPLKIGPVPAVGKNELWCLMYYKRMKRRADGSLTHDVKHFVERWNGSSWKKMGKDLPQEVSMILASPNGLIYVAKDRRGKDNILKWAKSKWKSFTIPLKNDSIRSLSIASDNSFWLISNNWIVYRWDGKKLVMKESKSEPYKIYTAFDGTLFAKDVDGKFYRWAEGEKPPKKKQELIQEKQEEASGLFEKIIEKTKNFFSDLFNWVYGLFR